MKYRLIPLLIILGLILGSYNISAENKKNEISETPQLQSDLPITKKPGFRFIKFDLDINEKLYSISNNNVEFYIKNGDSVGKAVWMTENCTIDSKTHIFTVKENEWDLGDIVFLGNNTGQKATNAADVTNKEPISSSGLLINKVVLIRENNKIYIKFQAADNIPDNIISKQTLQKNLKNNLLFVNSDHPLPQGYVPGNLVAVDKKKVAVANNDQKLLPVTANALYKMIEAAKKEKITGFIVNSTYRDISFQRSLFNNRLAINKKLKVADPFTETTKRVAYPGTSEHHTGMAIDILSKNGNSAETFGKTAESKWLKENSWKYGFAIRYAQDKQNLTKVMYEPWHIRFLGYPCSALLYKENLCYEEFMSYIQKNKIKTFYDQGKSYIFIYMDSINDLILPRGMSWEISQAGPGKYIVTLSY